MSIFDNSVLIKLFGKLRVTDDATEAHHQLCAFLKKNGYACLTEHLVPSRGDKRPGRIDVVATKDGVTVAIEFDKRSPRAKSLYKLRNFNADIKVVLLRGGRSNYRIGDIGIISVSLFGGGGPPCGPTS